MQASSTEKFLILLQPNDFGIENADRAGKQMAPSFDFARPSKSLSISCIKETSGYCRTTAANNAEVDENSFNEFSLSGEKSTQSMPAKDSILKIKRTMIGNDFSSQSGELNGAADIFGFQDQNIDKSSNLKLRNNTLRKTVSFNNSVDLQYFNGDNSPMTLNKEFVAVLKPPKGDKSAISIPLKTLNIDGHYWRIRLLTLKYKPIFYTNSKTPKILTVSPYGTFSNDKKMFFQNRNNDRRRKELQRDVDDDNTPTEESKTYHKPRIARHI